MMLMAMLMAMLVTTVAAMWMCFGHACQFGAIPEASTRHRQHVYDGREDDELLREHSTF